MAAAEARVVWQRTANRFLVQEDAKRAPKLTCFSSNSSSSSKQPETTPANNYTGDRNDRFPLPSDSRWWLQSQTDYTYQRGFTNSFQFVENQNDNSNNSLSKESFTFIDVNMDSTVHHWVGIDKNVDGELPWWQVTGKDDPGSIVSKKSHDPGSNPEKMIAIHQRPKELGFRESESSKRKILEALRHSQTRAREAETAAKEAYEEKEHVMKVVLRQASELFACRQWIHLLQIENLYYQIKNNKIINPMSSVSLPSKNGKLLKKMKKSSPGKGKRRGRRYEDNLGKYGVVFAMGLGLIGAGMLLGWTVGWMLIT